MANVQAFDTGYEQGFQRGSEPRVRQQALNDLELEGKIKEVQANIGSLQTKISDMKPGSPEYVETNGALVKAIQDRNDLFHPVKNPGVLRKFGHLLKIGPKPVQPSVTTDPGKVTIPAGKTDPITLAPTDPLKTPQQTMPSLADFMVAQNPQGLVAPGNIPIWNRPTIQNADGSHSSELSVSFADEKGHEILVPTIVDGKFLTPDGKMPPGPMPKDYESASPEWKAMWDKAWQHYEKSGQHLGKFDSADNADAYAHALHSRGQKEEPATPEVSLPGFPTEAQNVQFPGEKVTVKGPAMTPGELKAQAENLRKAQAEGQQIVAAAPMSQEQMSILQSHATDAARISSIKTTLAALPGLLGPDATPEDIERAKGDYLNKELGVLQKENWESISGTVDGQAVTWQRDKGSGRVMDLTGQPVSAEKLAKFVQDKKGAGAASKPPTSQFAINLDGYAKSHGFTDWNSYPGDQKEKVIDYIQRKIALDRALPKSTTSIRIMQDVNGAFVPVTETNYSTPGGNIKLVDPFPAVPKVPGQEEKTGMVAQNPADGTSKATPGPGNQAAQRTPTNATATTPNAPQGNQTPSGTKALLTEAKGKAPKANANVSVGAPLFQGRTPESDAARKALDAATNSYQDVVKASADPTPVGDQGIVLAWLRGRVNRVTATEIANVNNLGGATMKLEGKYLKIVNGLMTDEQRKWFLKSAKDNLDTAQDLYKNYSNKAPGTAPQPTPTPEPGHDDKINALVQAINGTETSAPPK